MWYREIPKSSTVLTQHNMSRRIIVRSEVFEFMVKLIVKFMGIPRQHTRTGQVEFESSKDTLREVLKEVVNSYHIPDVILTESGDVRPYARVLVNGRSYQFVGGMGALLHDGDAVALIYPWLGHEDF
jgi:molybdopterin converting factor small subunit